MKVDDLGNMMPNVVRVMNECVFDNSRLNIFSEIALHVAGACV